MVEGEPEFNVKEILQVQKTRNQFKWLVKWKGYGREDNTWEPLDNLKGAMARLSVFYKRYPNEPRPEGLKLRRSVFPREIFPDEFFGPLTTGVDESLPSEADLRRWALTQGANA